MGLIFYFSSQPPLHVSPKAWTDFAVKKTGHVGEYFILAWLLYYSLSHTTSLSSRRIWIWAIILAIFYAASDEFHQLLIVGREGRLRDVAIDSFGASISYLFHPLLPSSRPSK